MNDQLPLWAEIRYLEREHLLKSENNLWEKVYTLESEHMESLWYELTEEEQRAADTRTEEYLKSVKENEKGYTETLRKEKLAKEFTIQDIFIVNGAMLNAKPEQREAWERAKSKLIISANLSLKLIIPHDQIDENGFLNMEQK